MQTNSEFARTSIESTLLPVSVSVIICCYTERRMTLLMEAVSSVIAQMRGAPELVSELVVVVDNNSGLTAVLRTELDFRAGSWVRVSEHQGPRGLSGARNHGLGQCTGEVVIFLDDDAVLGEGSLVAVAETFTAPEGEWLSALAGSVRPLWQGGIRPRWFPEEFGWVVGCDYAGMPTEGSAVRNPIGACMAVRKKLIRETGGFSSELGRVGRLPVGCEETLMGIRLHQMYPGLRIERSAALHADHFVPAERQRFQYFRSRCYFEGKSKAVLAKLATRSALGTEYAYTTRVLPRAVLTAVGEGFRGDLYGFARAYAIIVGFAATVVGFASGKVSRSRSV